MHLFKKISFFMVCISAVASVFATDKKAVPEYTREQANISVTCDQSFTIKLDSNATTGYQWFLREFDHDLIEPVANLYVAAADQHLMGAPGYELWTFKAKATPVPQQTVIRLIYGRAFSSDDSGNTVFKISILPKKN